MVFATGQSKVRQPSKQVLEQLVNYLNKTPDISMVRLEGHTDTRGSEASNQTLSQKRVMAVADFLVDQGIEHTRLIAVAFGETRPLGPNDSSSGRQENRRTEFHIAEVSGQRFLGQDPTNGGLVLRIKSKAEREAEAEVGTVPTIEPPPFKPTGDIIEDVKMPDREKLLADDAPSNDGPQGTLPDKTN